MANESTHAFAHSTQLRAARFVRPGDVTDRHATWRPPEEIAQRRDVVEAFRMASVQDAASLRDSESTRALMGFGVALADEALGQVDRAHLVLQRYGTADPVSGAALAARLAHVERDDAAARAALRSTFERGTGNLRALAGLEIALTAWRDGAPAPEVLNLVETATAGVAALGGYAAVAATRLAVDSLLEAGRTAQALSTLESALEHPRISRPEKSALVAIYAVWASVVGQREQAVELLQRQSQKGLLHDDVERTLLHLLYELDRGADAFAVLAKSTLARQRPEAAVALANHARAHDQEACWETIRRALRDFPEDDALVEFAVQTLLEFEASGDELIDLLNRRLETRLSGARRVWTLCHLGRLYEARETMEAAAAEVYREVLTLSPGNATAIRALGRLFSRLEQWRALGDLYEQEIALEHGTPSVWRRHFQAAEVFEKRVKDDTKALEHYRAVLSLRAGFLPALKGAARILERHGQWAGLADLFLASVSVASNRRQKLYLLDKVADVAEQHLNNIDVAIGAWEEILYLEPEHPTAFAALGRLYARAQRWPELVRLNERELEIIDEPEEAAAMWVRNAEIANAKMSDHALAERFYRQALRLIPDYVPALEGLGRMLVRTDRFAELVTITDRQIEATADDSERWRRLGAVAELVESRAGLESDAIALYRRMHALRPNDTHVAETLAVLYRRTQDWRALCDLYLKLAERGDAATRAQLHGEVGAILEWRLEDPSAAFEQYILSLEESPSQPHVLEGVIRTWTSSKVDPAVLSDDLEDLSRRAEGKACHDQYMLIIARLRERCDHEPLRSLTFRQLGDADVFENQAVLRFAHAIAGQRRLLDEVRATRPLTAVECVQTASLMDADGQVRKAIIEVLPELDAGERAWVLSNLPTKHVFGFVSSHDGVWERFRADLGGVLEGAPPTGHPEFAAQWRLRAIEARLRGDLETAVEMTEGELATLRNREVEVLRCVELAQATNDVSWLTRACEAAFPSDGEPLNDGPVFERLRHGLEDAAQWDSLRFAFEIHVENPSLNDMRRAEVFEQLAQLIEERFQDPIAAAGAYQHSVDLVESRHGRASLVRVFEALGDSEAACVAQQKHYALTVDRDVPIDERHMSGLKLAELFEKAGRGDEAVHLLEELLHPVVESPAYRKIQRRLAYAHAEHGDVARAAELLEALIERAPTHDDVDDWRRLVRLRREDFGDVMAAYGLQWRLVRGLPGSIEDVDELFELAYDLGELGECCGQLVNFAREQKNEETRWKLIGRAAEAYDEDLHWADDATRLYRELIEVTSGAQQLHFRRRLSFCLSRSAGREAEAIRNFVALAQAEPFEVTNFQCLAELYERVQAYDRARLARQMLRALRVPTPTDDVRIKTAPSRAMDGADVHDLLVPKAFGHGVWDVIGSVMPLAEKIWADALPQKKALDGEKVKDPRVLQILENAFAMFGIKRVRAVASDSGPVVPFVFDDGTVWFNEEVLATAPEGEVRFLAGFAAALAWSGMASLVAFDGRHVWHLIEGVQYRQTGAGFTERVDIHSQQYSEAVGSAFHTVARRRVQQALEGVVETLADVHCEAWPLELQRFACRAGLVACGEVESAISAMLRIDGWNEPLSEDASQRRMMRSKEVEELLRFAFSDAYLEARYRLGLSGRPTRVG